MAQPFDAARAQLAGEAVPRAENIIDFLTVGRTYSASTTGVVIFRSAGATSGSRLIWFDRHGKFVGEVGQRGLYFDVVVTPMSRSRYFRRGEAATLLRTAF